MLKKYLILILVAISLIITSTLLFINFHEKISTRSTHRSYLQSLPSSYDPIKATDTNTQFVLNHLNDNLIKWSLDIGIEPQLALRWQFEDQGQKLTFYLNPKAKFSDGTPITGFRVVKALKRIISVEGYYKEHFINIAKVSALDDSTVVLQLNKKDPKILFLLASVPALITDINEKGDFIFSGPFTIDNIGKNTISLKRRNDYYGSVPKTEFINFHVGDDLQAKKLILSDQIDDTIILASPTPQVFSEHDNWISLDMWATWAIGFDLRNKKVSDTQLRLHLAKALTSKSFVKNIFPSQQVAHGLIPNGMFGNLTGENIMPDLKPLNQQEALEIIVPNEIPNSEQISRWIIENASNAKIKVHVAAMAFPEMISALGTGKMPSFLLSFNAEYPSPYFYLNALTTKGRSNFFGVDVNELEQAIGSISDTQDTQALASRMKKMNSYLLQRGVVIPLMHVKHHAWHKDCVEGIKYSPVSEGYFSLREVENKCPQK